MVPTGSSIPGGWQSEDSIWQLVECCDYVADLPAWTDLGAGRRVLDLGCGVGRVSFHLAEAGSEVTGVDRDPLMVDDFNRLAPQRAEAQSGDVLDPDAEMGRFQSVLAPQQLIQIVGGTLGRSRLLGLIARSLDTDGVAALAITEDLPERSISLRLTPDLREIDEWVYSSRPVSLEATPEQVTIERLRQRITPNGELTETTDRISFARVSRDSLRPEISAAGLRLKDVIPVPPTESHMASAILVLDRRRGNRA